MEKEKKKRLNNMPEHASKSKKQNFSVLTNEILIDNRNCAQTTMLLDSGNSGLCPAMASRMKSASVGRTVAGSG